MEPSTFLTVASILLTVVLGLGAISLTIRYSRRVSLSYIEDTCLALFDDVAQGISDLEILFRNSPVSHNIVLLRSYLANTGRRDISPSMVEKRIRIVLPEGFTWIDCRVTDTARSLQATVRKVTDTAIEFDLGLFKAREYFKFDALATVPATSSDEVGAFPVAPSKALREALRFEHRIADAYSVKNLLLRDLTMGAPNVFSRWGRRLSVLKLGTVLVVVGVLVSILFAVMSRQEVLAYEVTLPDGTVQNVHVTAKDGQARLHNRSGFDTTISLTEFDELQRRTILLPIGSIGTGLTLKVPLAYSGAGLFILLLLLVRWWRVKKYLRIIQEPKR